MMLLMRCFFVKEGNSAKLVNLALDDLTFDSSEVDIGRGSLDTALFL